MNVYGESKFHAAKEIDDGSSSRSTNVGSAPPLKLTISRSSVVQTVRGGRSRIVSVEIRGRRSGKHKAVMSKD
jgi:hypothetical protein